MMVISLLFPMNVQADQVVADVAAPHAILMEVSTGTVLMEKAADEKVHPASVTKIMTMLLIMEALEQGKIALNDTVTVSEYAASMGGSQVYLEPYRWKCRSVCGNDESEGSRTWHEEYPFCQLLWTG